MKDHQSTVGCTRAQLEFINLYKKNEVSFVTFFLESIQEIKKKASASKLSTTSKNNIICAIWL